MDERDIIGEKIAEFTELEDLGKLIEELNEAISEAGGLIFAIKNRHFFPKEFLLADGARKRLIEELSDVHVSGLMTLKRRYKEANLWHFDKTRKALREQIPEAIAQHKMQRNVVEGKHPADGVYGEGD